MKNGWIEDGIGNKRHYVNNKLHNDDGPASIHSNGAVFYYQHGEIHREDGPAVIHPNGEICYYQHGKIHRDYGPAVIHPNGEICYYQHGKIHSDYGPAIIYSNGKVEYFLNDEEITEEEFNKRKGMKNGGIEIDNVLKQREQQYGDFKNVSNIFKGIMNQVNLNKGPLFGLSESSEQWAAVHMIAMKLSRVVSGNPNNRDNWVDIAGYANLVLKSLDKSSSPSIHKSMDTSSSSRKGDIK